MSEDEQPKKVTLAEKIIVLGIFGALALFSLIKLENIEAASAYATTIATYYLSREGV